MHKSKAHERGERAEALARAYLEARGCEVILQNFLCRLGELDIVALEGTTLLIVEVRCRGANRIADAAATVSRGKQTRIVRATRYLLAGRHDLRPFNVRFDVIAFDDSPLTHEEGVTWIRGAFEAS